MASFVLGLRRLSHPRLVLALLLGVVILFALVIRFENGYRLIAGVNKVLKTFRPASEEVFVDSSAIPWAQNLRASIPTIRQEVRARV
jgi:hypothetical protein